MRLGRAPCRASPRPPPLVRPPLSHRPPPPRARYATQARAAPRDDFAHMPTLNPAALVAVAAGLALWQTSQDDEKKSWEEDEYLLYRTRRLRYFMPADSMIALAQRTESPIVRRKVAQLLAFMSEDDSTVAKMASEGVLDFLLHLASVSSDPAVQHSVATAVANFALIASCQPALLEDRSIALLQRWTKADDADVRHCTAKTLFSLSQSAELAPRLVKAGVLPMLTHLSAAAPSAETGVLLARTLANLTGTPASCREMLVADTSRLLTSLSSVAQANPEAQLSVAKAVTDLAQDDSGKALVVQSGWLEQLVALSKSSSKSVRLHVALALLNLVQADEIATKIMQEFGFPLFTSLADINDLEVQRVVERCLEKLNAAESVEERILMEDYCVLPDDEA